MICRDLSNNSFRASTFPAWLTSIQSLTTLSLSLSLSLYMYLSLSLSLQNWYLLQFYVRMMENTMLQGEIPVNLFNLPQLESVWVSLSLELQSYEVYLYNHIIPESKKKKKKRCIIVSFWHIYIQFIWRWYHKMAVY